MLLSAGVKGAKDVDTNILIAWRLDRGDEDRLREPTMKASPS